MELKLNEKYMLTIKEAAAYYGIGMKYLRRCAGNEDSKFGIVCGNRWMIIKDRFEEYLQACSESGKPFGDFKKTNMMTRWNHGKSKYGRARTKISE